MCLGLVLGGAIGTLIDRNFRSPGVLRVYVVDFITPLRPGAKCFVSCLFADPPPPPTTAAPRRARHAEAAAPGTGPVTSEGCAR